MMMLSSIYCIIYIIYNFGVALPIGGRIKPVAVFSTEETEYHKYAAVLAATEPFRLQRDLDIKKSLNPLLFWYHKVIGTQFNDPSNLLRIENKEIDSACERYERKADEIVRSYGLNVLRFNNLSRQIMEDSSLKRRILLQAYYYRIAADLEANISPSSLPTLQTSLGSSSTSSFHKHKSSKAGGEILSESDMAAISNSESSNRKSKLSCFAQVLYAIEQDRLRQRSLLQSELHITELPKNMCDNHYLPAMCTSIQQACVDFPKRAAQVTTQFGLETKDFNELDQRMKTDVLFRFRVQREIRRIERRNNNE